MQVKVFTKNHPEILIDAITNKYNDKKLKTWDIVVENEELIFVHKQQYESYVVISSINKDSNYIVFKAESPKDIDEDILYVLGRFVECLMVHFNEYYDRIVIK